MTISTTTTTAVLPLGVGDRARFALPAKEAHLWWVVQAGDDRFAILTRQATFRPKGELVYTIVDRERGVRGPCNRIGQGWDVEALGGCDRLLDALRRGDVEISHRNNISAEISQSQPGVEPRTAAGLPVPALTPLTREELASPHTIGGIDLQEDEDGTWVWTLGHHDVVEFAQAVTSYDQQLSTTPVAPHPLTDVEHTYAVVTHRTGDGDWAVSWFQHHRIDAETPGAFPVTVLTR